MSQKLSKYLLEAGDIGEVIVQDAVHNIMINAKVFMHKDVAKAD